MDNEELTDTARRITAAVDYGLLRQLTERNAQLIDSLEALLDSPGEVEQARYVLALAKHGLRKGENNEPH